MRWIAQNAGEEGSIVVNKVKELKGEQGYNAAKDKYENLVEAGVIDPTKVVRYAGFGPRGAGPDCAVATPRPVPKLGLLKQAIISAA